MRRRNLKLKKFLIISIAGLIILAGLLVGLVRLADLAVPEYREEVAAQVSQRLDRPVSIAGMDLSWDWHGPVLHLENAALLEEDSGKPAVQMQRLALHFEFWSLLRGRIQPAGISVSGAKLAVYRDADGRLRLRGLAPGASEFNWRDTAARIDEFAFVRATDASVTWYPSAQFSNPTELRNIQFSLENEQPRRRLQGTLQLPPELGGELALDAFVLGAFDAPETLRAHTYISGEKLDLTALANAAGISAGLPRTGRNNLEIWSDWREGSFTGARASLTGVETADDAARLLQAGAGMDFSVVPAEPGYLASLDALRGDDRYRQKMDGSLLILPQQKRLEGQLADIPASLLGGWLSLADGQSTWVTRGNLDAIRITWDASDPPGQLFARVEFSQLDASEARRGLDVRGLSGQLALSRSSGALTLSAADATLSWPGFINGRLPLDRLEGEIDWNREAGGWQIHANDMRWLGASAVVAGGGNISIPDDGPADVDIAAQVQVQRLPAVLAYIPQDPDLPNPRLRDWLPKAVQAGAMPAARVRLHGQLNRFPFAQGGGKFRIDAEVDEVTLAYKPGWPDLRQGKGEFTLEGDTLTIDAERARMLEVQVGPANARIANVREPILKIDGSVVNAAADQLLNFLPNSPLREKFGRLAEVIAVSGPADLALDLSIPLKSELGEVQTNGLITLQGVALEHRILPQPIENMRGEINFTRKGLRAQGLAGQLVGLPLTADLAPAGDGALAIDARAMLSLPRDAPTLNKYVPAPILGQIEGDGVWQASLQVAASGKVSDLRLTSELEGIALNFPPPFDKPAATTLPVSVAIGSGGGPIRMTMADRLRMNLQTANDRIESIDLLFGGAENLSAPPGPGIWLGGRIEELDLDRWRKFADRFTADGSGGTDGVGIGLRGAELLIRNTQLGGQRLPLIQLKAAPLVAESGWQATVSGAGAQGDIRWLRAPPGTVGARALIDAEFERLAMDPVDQPQPDKAGAETLAANATSPERESPPFDPRVLPVTNLDIASLQLDGTDYGRLQLQARAVKGGVALTRLNIDGGVLDLDAEGDWRREDGLTRASLRTRIGGAGLDSLFATLGYAPSIRADRTRITADLIIDPNPGGLDPAALNGTIQMQLDDGTLLTVNPGAGRVLGLFNFYALPRRFALDFRDVIDDGMAFDSIRGDFNIQSGIARSDNLRIRTPSALVNIDGEVNMAQRSYDQRVRIVPKVSSSVAIAGTVLGGPAVGAALLVAQKLLEKPIQDLSSVTYQLTGDWQDPEIDIIDTQK